MTRSFRQAAPVELNLGAMLAGPFEPHAFRSPWWLIGGNAQTIVPARLACIGLVIAGTVGLNFFNAA